MLLHKLYVNLVIAVIIILFSSLFDLSNSMKTFPIGRGSPELHFEKEIIIIYSNLIILQLIMTILSCVIGQKLRPKKVENLPRFTAALLAT